MSEPLEIARIEESTELAAPQVAEAINQIAAAMHGLADMMRATNERMTSLDNRVRLLEKVTGMQLNEINATIRARAAELCEMYRIAGQEKPVANAIRRAVRLTTGVQSLRELPRCEYTVVLKQVQMWDDYKAMKAIKGKAGK